MDRSERNMFLIRLPYWLGIGTAALWAVALFCHPLMGLLVGFPTFDQIVLIRVIMALGGSLMTGWALLLLWAVRKPIERRAVILITAYPPVLGLLATAFIALLGGNTTSIWIICKSIVLLVSMTMSYILACRVSGAQS